ncbi:MAG: PspC domain-containing protein, partial [Solirubrobacteraceae bacterium]|nr:PspC domain-containing protein [Solirubrobacteraceae bacterium]
DPPPSEPPKLLRAADDRVIGGVCAGVARRLSLDPLVIRIAAVVLVLVGGAGALLYLAGLLLIPDERTGTTLGGGDDTVRGKLATATGIVVLVIAALVFIPGAGFWLFGPLVPIAVIALLGLTAWWVVSGEGASGGAGQIGKRILLGLLVLTGCFVLAVFAFYAGTTDADWIVAGVVVAAGVALLVGSFVRQVRWLILPALAIALPLAAAEASDLDLTGGMGERTYRPATAAQVRDDYELGAGRLVVDLRNTELPDGDTPVRLRIGAGEAVLLVDRDTCVATRAEFGAGGLDVFDEDSGGVGFDWEDIRVAKRGNPRVLLDADVGVGHLLVDHVDHDDWNHDRADWDDRDIDRQTACEGRAR